MISTFSHKLAMTALLVTFCGLMGCNSGQPWNDPAPDSAFRSFLMDWTMGKRERVFKTLVDEDQATIKTAHAAVLKTISKDDKAPKVHELFLGSGVATPFALKKVSLEKKLPETVEKGHAAKVLIEFHDGRQGDATMIWDGTRWRLKLGLAKPT